MNSGMKYLACPAARFHRETVMSTAGRLLKSGDSVKQTASADRKGGNIGSKPLVANIAPSMFTW